MVVLKLVTVVVAGIISGGFLPATAIAIVVSRGDIYSGLWYPIIIALGTFVIGMLFIKETKDVDILAKD